MRVLTRVSPVAPASTAAAAMGAQVGDVGRQFGEHREPLGHLGDARRAMTDGGGVGVVGEHVAPVLQVRAADIDLEGDEAAEGRREGGGRLGVVVDAAAPDGGDHPRAPGQQRRQVVVEPGGRPRGSGGRRS